MEVTLRDAVREMVRWWKVVRVVQRGRWGEPNRWADRNVFRADMIDAAAEIVEMSSRQSIDYTICAARVVCELSRPDLEGSWRTATRAVWATL